MTEDIQKLIQARKNPVNSLQDLDKRLIGTRDGFIFYTTNFRKDFDAKMYMLGRLEQENEELKKQQKEFVNWLENKVKVAKINNQGCTYSVREEILSKYKEIIGDAKDE